MPTILVADDNSNIHKMVELAFKELGYRIERVGNGEHAVRQLPKTAPDLILADIFMPVRNGYEVCEYVKTHEEYAHIPVVLLQGRFDPLDEHEMKRVRADGVVMKPFVPPDQLIATVKTLLEKARPPKPAVPAGPSPESTVQMSSEEVATLTTEKPAAPPEPEIAEYSTAPPRIEFSEAERPLAFQDLLETPPAEVQAIEEVHAEQLEAAPPELQAPRVAETKASEEPATVEATPAEPETPEWGGIREEPKQPSPEEPPIHVEFGEAEPMELVTEETEVGPSAAETLPLPELVTTGAEWMTSAAPAVSAPAEKQEVLQPAPVGQAAEVAPVMPAAKPYETPKFEALEVPAAQADAVPAATVPAPEPVVPPAVPELKQAVAEVQAFTPSPPLDPALVDAVVEKVIARLQPHMMDRITREILRPLVQALLSKEPEK